MQVVIWFYEEPGSHVAINVMQLILRDQNFPKLGEYKKHKYKCTKDSRIHTTGNYHCKYFFPTFVSITQRGEKVKVRYPFFWLTQFIKKHQLLGVSLDEFDEVRCSTWKLMLLIKCVRWGKCQSAGFYLFILLSVDWHNSPTYWDSDFSERNCIK